MKVAAFLPVKGSSQRIPNKNVALLDGKPLFLHTLEKLLTCDFLDEVYLDSESDQIFQIASYVEGFRPLRRDPELATNKTDGHRLFYNEVLHTDADLCLQILCTSPFIEVATLRRGVEILAQQSQYDSVVLVRRDKLYTWNDQQPQYDHEHIPNSVDLPETIIETMGLYIVRRETALAERKRYGRRVYFLEATPLEAVDVNVPVDFVLAGYLAAGKREKERALLNNLRHFITSALLSDILDESGLQGVVSGLSPGDPQNKIFGRAKTLKLRRLRKDEDPHGIYDALQSYRTIVPNDVIVVENEVPEFAYFGELNANLALRAGACGAVIGGMTRDRLGVAALNFPVFASGRICRDVRGCASVESINQRIRLGGIPVAPGDLVFADVEGVVVIPRPHEAAVLERVIDVVKTERHIKLDIALGDDVDDLVSAYGTF